MSNSATYSDIFAPTRVRMQSSSAFHRHPASPRVGGNRRFVFAVKTQSRVCIWTDTVVSVVASFSNETYLRDSQDSSALVAARLVFLQADTHTHTDRQTDSLLEPAGRKREVTTVNYHHCCYDSIEQSWKLTFPVSLTWDHCFVFVKK